MRPLLLVPVLLLGACAGQTETPLPTAWARADGKPINTGLLDIDTTDCKDGLQKPDEVVVPGKADRSADSKTKADDFAGCMREHGYVQARG